MRKQPQTLAVIKLAQRNSNSHWPWEVVTYWLRRCVSQMFKAATFRPLKAFSHGFHPTGITVRKEICIFELKMEANWSHTFEQQPFSGKNESQTQPNEAAIHSNQVSHPTPVVPVMLHQRSPRASLPPCSRCPRSALKRADSVFPNSSRTCIWELHENTSLTSLRGVNGLGWFLLIWHDFITFASWCIVMYDDLSRFYHDVSVGYGVSEGHVSKFMSFTWKSSMSYKIIWKHFGIFEGLPIF